MKSKPNDPRPDSGDSVRALIRTIRDQRVILDADLAALYGVPTFRFNEAVKRNAARFPEDFRFQLTRAEFAGLKSQIAISRAGGAPNSSQTAMSPGQHGGRRKLPWAFTEHGALASAGPVRFAAADPLPSP